MSKKIIVLLAIAAFIVYGFLMGAIFGSRTSICSKKGCGCFNQPNEVPCNSCASTDSIFYTFIINYDKDCSSKEIVLCEDNKIVGKRYDVDEKSCRYNFKLFGGTIKGWTLAIKTLFFGYPGADNTPIVSVPSSSP